MIFQILKIASLIAIFQTILLIVFFNSKRNRSLPNIFLSLLLCIYTSQIFLVLFMTSFPVSILMKFNIFPALCHQFVLLFGPLLLLFSKSLINKKISTYNLFHVIPFFIMIGYIIYRQFTELGLIIWFSSFKFISSYIILIHSLLYLIVAGIFIYTNYDQFKAIHKISKTRRYITFTLIGLITLWLLKFNIFVVIDVWKRFHLCPYASGTVFISGFLLVNIFMYLALIYPELFVLKKKYKNKYLSDQQKQQILTELKKYMELEKIYSNSSVSLADLARKMGVTVTNLSQAINEELRQSFTEYINDFRIREAEKLLMSHPEYNIQQIMFDVGFNSRSVFNNTFKQYFGLTPTEYRKNNVE